MMNIYAADDHILAITDTIEADLHSHLFIQVSVSLDSDFRMDIDGDSFSCRGIIIDSNIKHCFGGNRSKQMFLLIDNTSKLAKQLRNTILGDKEYCVLSDETVDKISALITHNFQFLINSSDYWDVLIQLLKVFGIEYKNLDIMDERISQVIDLLKACNSSEHSIKMFAKEVCLSESRLSHLFKENTGVSLSSYIVLHKLQKAMIYIFDKMSITDAALLAGFDSPSHFAAVSKRLLGMPAKELSKDSVFLKVSRYK
jgi:AraC-like DNA-binding protein